MMLDCLDIDRIESIAFSQRHNDRLGALEVFTRQELKEIFDASKSKTLVLELHNQYCVEGNFKHRSFIMEIRPSINPSTQDQVRYAELHYIELDAAQPSAMLDAIDDTVIRTHQPFLWSVNVGIKNGAVDPSSPSVPARILFYSASGDGSHVATLSTKDKILQLDMWDLETAPHSTAVTETSPEATPSPSLLIPKPYTNGDMDTYIENRRPFSPKSCGQLQKSINRPVATDIFYNPQDSWSDSPIYLRISLSYNASKVALMDGGRKFLGKAFQAFAFNKQGSSIEKNSPHENQLQPIPDDYIGPYLKNYRGLGKFHFITKDRDAEDELFITCDWYHVDIFTIDIDQRWERIRRITLSTSRTSRMIPYADRLIEGLNGRYFQWWNRNTSSVCDLETGKTVHTMPLDTAGYLSSDGSLMLCLHYPNTMTIRWTESGTILGATDLPITFRYSGPAFIQNDSRVIFPLVKPDDVFGRGRLGVILDATTLSVVERVSYSTRYFEQQTQSTGSHGQYIYSIHGSKLDLIRLRDIKVPPYTQQRSECDRRCSDSLTEVQQQPTARSSPEETNSMYVPGSDLILTIRYQWFSDVRYGIAVSISNGQGKSREVLEIPPLAIGSSGADYRIYLDIENLYLIADCRMITMAWKLPTTFEGNATLRSAFWTQPIAYMEAENDQALKDTKWSVTPLKTCGHRQLYSSLKDELNETAILPLYSDEPFICSSSRGFSALFMLIYMFDTAEESFRQATLKYVGLYINRILEYDGHAETILTMICKYVRSDNYASINAFLKAVLTSPHVRWVPKPGSNREMNPISLLLNVAEALPRAIDLAQILIKYCIRMAKKEKDPHFLSPVLDSLRKLVQLQEVPPDLVPSVLRGLAFCPVKDRSYIINHGIIAHPPHFRWPFGKLKEKPIYACENPILKLDHSPLYREYNPLAENFARDLFVASFDMLWCVPEAKRNIQSVAERVRDHGPSHRPSWIRTLIAVIQCKCKFQPDTRIECFDIPLETLDNPAIAALIEYKWNTIGYMYWMARFLWQCVFYILVLVAVFMQVYDSTKSPSLVSVFIAIMVMASLFLLLEVQQLSNNPGRYIRSPYNLLDLVAFGVPLAASACQIANIMKDDDKGNKSTLSFSVLLISLHILFELRVNKNVCHYVAIIIRIIGKIRIFFAIFVFGILAFAIAILHLLRGCPVDVCEETEVAFPLQFHRAISATYFFMGGIWDPVSDNFNEGDWDFHIMMMMYFFFTSILLLNVLIALMNLAFNDGDTTWELTWKESRLRCVEGAETATYNIPGFREAYDMFPDKIYYFATHKEQKEFHAKYSQEDTDDLIGGSSDDISGSGDARTRSCEHDQQDPSKKSHPASSSSTAVSLKSSTVDLEAIKQGQEELKAQHETKQQELKQELQSQGLMVARLVDQLQEQKHEFERQMAEMKEMLAAALAARS
ncbi:hypothetical protein BGX34_010700 [Mortierella sp. NVP85]|nr:hypothetical protein BGX34_010700 [Mortierella sp. NVP85]